jgi:hypothetical protein
MRFGQPNVIRRLAIGLNFKLIGFLQESLSASYPPLPMMMRHAIFRDRFAALRPLDLFLRMCLIDIGLDPLAGLRIHVHELKPGPPQVRIAIMIVVDHA